MSTHDDASGRGFKDATALTQWVRWALYLEIVLGLYFSVDGLINYLSGVGLSAENPANTQGNAFQDLVRLLRLGAIVLIAMWIYRANFNAARLGAKGMEYSPAAALGWYLVPLANLWKPYEAMREIWQASASPSAWKQQPVPTFVPWWWVLWTTSGIVSTMALLTAQSADASLQLTIQICNVMNLVATVIFLRMVESIHFMQLAALNKLRGTIEPSGTDGLEHD